jgi:hypothetical protein
MQLKLLRLRVKFLFLGHELIHKLLDGFQRSAV